MWVGWGGEKTTEERVENKNKKPLRGSGDLEGKKKSFFSVAQRLLTYSINYYMYLLCEYIPSSSPHRDYSEPRPEGGEEGGKGRPREGSEQEGRIRTASICS